MICVLTLKQKTFVLKLIQHFSFLLYHIEISSLSLLETPRTSLFYEDEMSSEILQLEKLFFFHPNQKHLYQ